MSLRTGWTLVGGLFAVIVIGTAALVLIPSPEKAQAPTRASIADLITVDSPLKNTAVAQNFTVSGTARGAWYFEATAPLILKDASGQTIAQTQIRAQGDWMTTDFVPFTATVSFPPQPAGSHGTLVLKNDNPSGDLSKQKELDIPVTF